MAIANTRKRAIPPTHPGEMLREDFLPDSTLTVTALAADTVARRRPAPKPGTDVLQEVPAPSPQHHSETPACLRNPSSRIE